MREKNLRHRSLLDEMKNDPLKGQVKKAESTLTPQYYTDALLQEIVDYNKNLSNLDPKYTQPTMLGQILVRCFLYEPNVSEAGLVEPYYAYVDVPTPTGHKHHSEENMFPYSLKAVVVNAPETYRLLKQGSIIQLKPNAVQLKAMGDSKGGFEFTVANAFKLVGNKPTPDPKKINDPNYGYVLINYSDIDCILQDVE